MPRNSSMYLVTQHWLVDCEKNEMSGLPNWVANSTNPKVPKSQLANDLQVQVFGNCSWLSLVCGRQNLGFTEHRRLSRP